MVKKLALNELESFDIKLSMNQELLNRLKQKIAEQEEKESVLQNSNRTLLI